MAQSLAEWIKTQQKLVRGADEREAPAVFRSRNWLDKTAATIGPERPIED